MVTMHIVEVLPRFSAVSLRTIESILVTVVLFVEKGSFSQFGPLGAHARCLAMCRHQPNATRPNAPYDQRYTPSYMDQMCSATHSYARCIKHCGTKRQAEALLDTREDNWIFCRKHNEVLVNQYCFKKATNHMSDCYRSACKSRLALKIKNWAVINDSQRHQQLQASCQYWHCSHECLFNVPGLNCTDDGLYLISEYGSMAVNYWLEKISLYAKDYANIKSIEHLYSPNCCPLLQIAGYHSVHRRLCTSSSARSRINSTGFSAGAVIAFCFFIIFIVRTNRLAWRC